MWLHREPSPHVTSPSYGIVPLLRSTLHEGGVCLKDNLGAPAGVALRLVWNLVDRSDRDGRGGVEEALVLMLLSPRGKVYRWRMGVACKRALNRYAIRSELS